MTFSARSFGLASRSARRAASSSGVRPRGRVPLIGRVSTSPSGRPCRNRSGEALSDLRSRRGRSSRRTGPGCARAAGRRVRAACSRQRGEQPLRQVHLEAVAGVDVLDGPADGRLVAVAVEVAGDARAAGQRDIADRRPDAASGAGGRSACRPRSTVGNARDRCRHCRQSAAPGRVGLAASPVETSQARSARGRRRGPSRTSPTARSGTRNSSKRGRGSALDVVAQVVAEQPGDAALERRQPGDRCRAAIGGEQSASSTERIAASDRSDASHEPIRRTGRPSRTSTGRSPACAVGAVEEQQVRQVRPAGGRRPTGRGRRSVPRPAGSRSAARMAGPTRLMRSV